HLCLVWFPVESRADCFSGSAVAVVNYFLCFEREGPVLLPESKVECEGYVGGWGEGEIAALVTVDPPARISLMSTAAGRECSVALLVQPRDDLSYSRVYPAKVALRL